RGGFVAINVANIGRALPSLALLAFALPIAIALGLGLGFWPTLFALVPLAIPPILTSTFVAVREVDRDVVDAARGMGFRESQILRSIEIPLGLPLMLDGMRTASVNVVATATLGAIVAATACGGAGTQGTANRPDVIIGSTNFYEQLTLGELYAQILEANGYKVTRKFNLGNREIVQPAIESGQIDIDAEYLATLLAFVDKNGTIAKPTTDPKTTQTGLQKALDPKQLTVLDFAAATDQNGFVITKATADAKNIKAISDLQPYAGNYVLGGPPECPQRPFCQLGLKTVYGLEFKDFKPLDAGGPL